MSESFEVWRIITEFSNYEVSNLGRVRNATTHKVLKTFGEGALGSVKLTGYQGPVSRGVRRLMQQAFEISEAGEKWVTCKDAYQYSVSNMGRVMNNKTGRILKPNKNGQVTLMDVGWRVCRTVSKLVKEHFET